MLPPSADVQIDFPDTLTPGISGYVECVQLALKRGGLELSLDELLCVSSASFARYVYDPKLNPHETDDREFSPLGELFSNYGVFESLGYYTGWRISELNEMSDVDFWKLLRFELASGRPMVSVGFGELNPVMLIGYREDHNQRWVTVWSNDGVHEVDFSSIRRPQGDSEVFVNFAVIVRESTSPDWAASKNRQRMAVLHWAVRHNKTQKEFLHETRENYAPGRSGGDVIVQSLRKLGDDVELAQYLSAHVQGQRRSKLAAANVLGDWGRDLAAEVDVEEVATALGDAATEFEKAIAALGADDHLGSAYQAFLDHEQLAYRHIETAIQHLPNAFG